MHFPGSQALVTFFCEGITSSTYILPLPPFAEELDPFAWGVIYDAWFVPSLAYGDDFPIQDSICFITRGSFAHHVTIRERVLTTPLTSLPWDFARKSVKIVYKDDRFTAETLKLSLLDDAREMLLNLNFRIKLLKKFKISKIK